MNYLERAGYDKAVIEKRIDDTWHAIFDRESSERFYFDAPDRAADKDSANYADFLWTEYDPFEN
ncbi:MAG TPA: hypothetical protein DCL73_00015 [Treponema sp.]|nr:hypothetical protein [Treponema sp.]